jgi:hypothetical protein
MIDFMTHDENRDETMQVGFELMVLAHAMTDFLSSDDNNFRAFCQFADITEDADIEQMRETFNQAHDLYEGMAMRANTAIAVERLRSGLAEDAAASQS